MNLTSDNFPLLILAVGDYAARKELICFKAVIMKISSRVIKLIVTVWKYSHTVVDDKKT